MSVIYTYHLTASVVSGDDTHLHRVDIEFPSDQLDDPLISLVPRRWSLYGYGEGTVLLPLYAIAARVSGYEGTNIHYAFFPKRS